MLFGAGSMAVAYAEVLEAQHIDYAVFGRGRSSATRFTAETNKPVVKQEFESFYHGKPIPTIAIVAVSNDQLAPLALRLIAAGVKEILLEKPGGVTQEEVELIAKRAKEKGAKVLLGLNRRFYASTKKAREVIEEDGGATSCKFDFTEWMDRIGDGYAPSVYATWILSNPVHVLDLAFSLVGKPDDMASFRAGGNDWHTSGTVFSGAGTTEQGVAFSYHADWDSAGRWSVEIMTRHRKLIFSPMEKLAEVKRNSVQIVDVDIDDHLDVRFKPGIFRQVEAFIQKNYQDFCTIDDQCLVLPWYFQIAGYKTSFNRAQLT